MACALSESEGRGGWRSVPAAAVSGEHCGGPAYLHLLRRWLDCELPGPEVSPWEQAVGAMRISLGRNHGR